MKNRYGLQRVYDGKDVTVIAESLQEAIEFMGWQVHRVRCLWATPLLFVYTPAGVVCHARAA